LTEYQQGRAHASRPHDPRLTAEQSQTETEESDHAANTGEEGVDWMHHSNYFLSFEVQALLTLLV
jgi:hypothetical protein